MNRKTYSYTNGYLTQEIYENWIDDEWKNNFKKTFSYTENGDIAKEVRAQWDGKKWVNQTQLLYTYNSPGKQSLQLSQKWENNSWINNYQTVTTYNPEGKPISVIYQYWNDESWTNEYQLTETYHSSGEKKQAVWQKWIQNQWKNANADYYSDPNLYKETGLYSFTCSEIFFYCNNNPTPCYFSEENSSLLLEQNYPNPADLNTNISYFLPSMKEFYPHVILDVYTISGQTVARLTDQPQAAGHYTLLFDTSSLLDGTYLYCLRVGSSVYTRKMMIVH